jgi:hypothetical protein
MMHLTLKSGGPWEFRGQVGWEGGGACIHVETGWDGRRCGIWSVKNELSIKLIKKKPSQRKAWKQPQKYTNILSKNDPPLLGSPISFILLLNTHDIGMQNTDHL